MRPAIFLDRDGTLIVEKHYLHRPEEVEIFPEAAPALRRLGQAGFALVVVTNQSGVGRGYYTEADVHRVHDHLRAELARSGVEFLRFYSAFEAPDQPSRGRKPSPQFLWESRDEFGIDLSASYMVGDKRLDLEAGWNAGVKASFLVRTGYGAELERSEGASLHPAIIVDGWRQVAERILGPATAPAV